MDASPNFEAGPLDQMLGELARFYRSLGYLVEQAYRHVEGSCACGDSACRKNPHFATEKIDPAASHLVMRAEAALSTCDMGILQRASRFGAVPILRHGSTSYLFVSDPQTLPDVCPVLGPARGWIALPPHRSDAPDGRSALPSWISALSLRSGDLPQAVDVFGPSVILRMGQLLDLGEHLWEFAGEGAIATREIVAAALEDLFATTVREEVVTFLAACCVGKMITTGDAAVWLGARTDLFPDKLSISESLNKAIAGVILSDGVIVTDEMKELLEGVAVRLADVDPDAGDDSEGDDPESDEDDGHRDARTGVAAERERLGVESKDLHRERAELIESHEGDWAAPRTATNTDPTAVGSNLSDGKDATIAAASFAATNWADALEQQESLLFSAALALFTPGGSAAGPIEQIGRSDFDIDEAEKHPYLPEIEPELDSAKSDTSEEQVEIPATPDDLGLDESGEVPAEELPMEATLVSDAEIAGMREMLAEVSVPLDWRGALSGSEDMVLPVALVQIFLEMDDLDFDQDPLTKLALLDMAITAIPDGTDDPLALFPYLWRESGDVMSDFRQHRIIVELLAGLLLRFDMACAAGVLMGDVSFVSLLALDPVQVVSDLVGDPELVFWLERHLFNVTTRDQLGTRLSTISKIISAVGSDIVGDVSTEYLRSLLGGGIND